MKHPNAKYIVFCGSHAKCKDRNEYITNLLKTGGYEGILDEILLYIEVRSQQEALKLDLLSMLSGE